MSNAPRPIEDWIKTTRRLRRVEVDGSADAQHNQVLLVQSGGVINLPEPIEGTEVIVKTITDEEINIVSPPNSQIDDYGQDISTGEWQAAYFASNGEQWFLINRVGDSFEVAERPQFVLSDLAAPSEIEFEDTLTVSVDVENTGDKGRDSIELLLDGDVLDSESDLTLEAEETETVTLSGEVTKDLGTYDLEVSTPDDSITQSIDVIEPGTIIDVFDYSSPVEVDYGEEITLSATVRNGGEADTDVPIDLIVDEGTDNERVVGEKVIDEIAFREEIDISFDYEVDISSGSANLGIYTPDASVSQALDVSYDQPSVHVKDLEAPSSASGGERISVSATVRNYGVDGTDLPIRLQADGNVLREKTVDLDNRQSKDVSFSYTVELDAGTYSLGIHSDESNRTQDFEVKVEETEVLINEFSVQDEVSYGEDIEVSAEVQNFGRDSEDTPVSFALDEGTDDERVIETKRFDLGYLDTEQVEFTHTVTEFVDTINAGVFTSDDEARQDVSILFDDPTLEVTNLDSPVNNETGDDIEVTADITNFGDPGSNLDVELILDGESKDDEVIGSTSVTLETDETETVSFDFFVDIDVGEYEIGVFTDNDSETDDFNVDYSDTNVEVSDLDAPDVAESGETIDVSADLFNIGEPEDEVLIELLIDGQEEDSIELDSKDVDIPYNEEVSVSFETEIDVDDGEYQIGIFSPHDSQERSITVSGTDVRVSNLDAPEEVDFEDEITVSASLNNDGIGGTDIPITFNVDGEEEETTTVDLDFNESTDVSFNYTVNDESEDIEVEIASDTDSESKTVNINFDDFFVLVDDLDVQSSANFGEEVDVGATLTNVGETNEDILIELIIDGEDLDNDVISTQNVDMEEGEVKDILFTFEVDQDAGDYEIGVFSPNASSTQIFEVLFDDTELLVSNLESPESAERGDEITASADITNVGAPEEDISVGLVLDRTFKVLETETIAELIFEETENVSFTHVIDTKFGDYQLGISTVDDIDEDAFTILDSFLELVGIDLNNPETEDSVLFVDEEFSTTSDLTNDGNLDEDEGTVELIADEGTEDEVVMASKTVELDQEETTAVEFTETADLDLGTRDIGIYTKDTSVSEEIDVLDSDVQVSNIDSDLEVDGKVVVEEDDEFETTADLENIGKPVTDEPIELIVDEGTEDEEILEDELFTLDYKESDVVTFTTVADFGLGEYELGIYSTDDSDTIQLEVVDEADVYDVEITNSETITPGSVDVEIESTDVEDPADYQVNIDSTEVE